METAVSKTPQDLVHQNPPVQPQHTPLVCAEHQAEVWFQEMVPTPGSPFLDWEVGILVHHSSGRLNGRDLKFCAVRELGMWSTLASGFV